jgi:hypothetical protein
VFIRGCSFEPKALGGLVASVELRGGRCKGRPGRTACFPPIGMTFFDNLSVRGLRVQREWVGTRTWRWRRIHAWTWKSGHSLPRDYVHFMSNRVHSGRGVCAISPMEPMSTSCPVHRKPAICTISPMAKLSSGVCSMSIPCSDESPFERRWLEALCQA